MDESLNQSVAIPGPAHLNTSHLMENVISDVSYDAATFQNRATPIDFGTREVKTDEDVIRNVLINITYVRIPLRFLLLQISIPNCYS
ncbi:hypothetical protein L3Y34_008352 [Caenorhabditis briggsae]|uniref:Uncharacterized protein n=1 Tax=Caenorhabditis briggsae TaxID=6238 RepID=A0AAE9D117_CAEBR|nr:hypothetical protein L3Y34_008352 [Caenorhabditis briggsae]